MALGTLLVPMLELGNHRQLAATLGDDPLDRHVQIPHHAELAVQPLQFGPDLRPKGIIDYRREEADGGAQMCQCNPDLVQCLRIAAAGAVMLGENGGEVTAGDDPEGGVADYA